MAVDSMTIWLRFVVANAAFFVTALFNRLRGSLTPSGTLATYVFLAAQFVSGYRYGALLLAFLVTSWILESILRKKKFNREFWTTRRAAPGWNWTKVMIKCWNATIMVMVLSVKTGGEDWCIDTKQSVLVTCLIGSIVGHYAGNLNVQKGSNGAVNCKVLVSAALVGGMVGLTYELLGFLTADCGLQLGIIPICAFAGLLRSLLCSLQTLFSHCTLQSTTNSDSSDEDCIEMQCGKVMGPVAKQSGEDFLNNMAIDALLSLLISAITAFLCLGFF